MNPLGLVWTFFQVFPGENAFDLFLDASVDRAYTAGADVTWTQTRVVTAGCDQYFTTRYDMRFSGESTMRLPCGMVQTLGTNPTVFHLPEFSTGDLATLVVDDDGCPSSSVRPDGLVRVGRRPRHRWATGCTTMTAMVRPLTSLPSLGYADLRVHGPERWDRDGLLPPVGPGHGPQRRGEVDRQGRQDGHHLGRPRWRVYVRGSRAWRVAIGIPRGEAPTDRTTRQRRQTAIGHRVGHRERCAGYASGPHHGCLGGLGTDATFSCETEVGIP